MHNLNSLELTAILNHFEHRRKKFALKADDSLRQVKDVSDDINHPGAVSHRLDSSYQRGLAEGINQVLTALKTKRLP